MVNLTLQFITYIFQVAFLNIFYSGSPLLAFRPLSIIARSAGVKVSHSNSNILFHIFDQKSCQFIIFIINICPPFFKAVISSISSQIKVIFKVLLACALLWLIFATMGVQLFAGKFYKVFFMEFNF